MNKIKLDADVTISSLFWHENSLPRLAVPFSPLGVLNEFSVVRSRPALASQRRVDKRIGALSFNSSILCSVLQRGCNVLNIWSHL